jgi:poly-beta-1,6-N-acetyl-D-glucosamine N-deacetylase
MTTNRATTVVRAMLLNGLLCAVAACGAPHAAPADGAGAVVLLYHHVAEETPPSTSVTPVQFASHLQFLADNDFRVVALSKVIAAVRDAAPLPERAVAITFDDAYRSVLTSAVPLLQERGWPFTVFVSTDYIDNGYGAYLDWNELRRLEAAGAEIGNHSRTHAHYPFHRAGESASAWRARIRADMAQAQRRLEAELASPLAAIAYPYGEFTPAVTAIAGELGLVGFGQQSGAVGRNADPLSLARYPMASGYASIDQLAEKLRTRAFRVTVRSPSDPVLPLAAAAPTLELQLAGDYAALDALSCFVGGQDAPQIRWLDRERGIVAVTANAPLPVGRSKYTCTAPATDADGVYYWYSHLWMKPPAADRWYAD